MPYDANGNWYDDSAPWLDTINNAIWAGAQTAQVALSQPQYPPYPQYYPQYQQPALNYPTTAYPQYTQPPLYSQTLATGVRPVGTGTTGFSLTGNTGLWVIGGIVLLALVMKKR